MSTDLEKARQAVIEAAREYVWGTRFPNLRGDCILSTLIAAVHNMEYIEREARPSDGGRMNETSIGGENV